MIVDIAILGIVGYMKRNLKKNQKISGFEVGDWKNVECKKCGCSTGCCWGAWKCY